ncbi:MAG: hypothetical protein HY691_03500, partial [Chloroflexi bacterium]|nr:hypothetical protein [Chloroflexota bacterium]
MQRRGHVCRGAPTAAQEEPMPTIEWLGHDAFRIGDGTTIYIDPWEI